MIPGVKALLFSALLIGLPMGFSVQPIVRGTVISADGLPLSGVRLQLTAPGGAPQVAETDEAGRFQFTSPAFDNGLLVARRIGYRPDSIRVRGETTALTLQLERLPATLETVRTIGRRDLTGPMAGFYRRMQTGGGGRFITLAEIEKRNHVQMTDVLRMIPGLRIETRGFINHVRMRGSRCAPLVWLDGNPMFAGEVDLDAFDPRTFDGIEIYSGPATVPVEFHGNQRMNSSCGVIVLWSRRGEPRARRAKKGEPTASERIARLLEERTVFLADGVDRAARLDSSALVRPVYPDSLHDARTSGRVLAEFVVGDNGRAMMETFSAVTTSHRDFVEPVRRAVAAQEFTPATRRGRTVAQVLQWTYEFVPDSLVSRR
ncbi:MAG: hypothetical protein RLZZ621_1514 [Gemmatimonadota bacterium]